jgi:hypothetical protein
MKLRYLLALLFFGLLLISSCKKDDDESTFQFDKYPRIKSIQSLGKSGYTLNFEYDSKGRLIKSDQDGIIQKFEYSDSKVINTFPGSQGTLLYFLNADGLADSTNYGIIYGYNENGYMVHQFYDTNNEWTITILNGNRSRAIRIVSGYLSYSDYSYNQKNNTIGNENNGMGFEGKQNINLTSKEIYYKLCYFPDTIYHSYDFDIKDRVVKQIIVNSGKSDTILYTYY